MGDTYFIDKLNCAYCGKENDFDCENSGISLYPGIGWTSEHGTDFVCDFCKKKNKVKMEFIAVKSSNKKSINV